MLKIDVQAAAEGEGRAMALSPPCEQMKSFLKIAADTWRRCLKIYSHWMSGHWAGKPGSNELEALFPRSHRSCPAGYLSRMPSWVQYPIDRLERLANDYGQIDRRQPDDARFSPPDRGYRADAARLGSTPVAAR